MVQSEIIWASQYSTQQDITDVGDVRINMFNLYKTTLSIVTFSYGFPVPVKSAVKSYWTAWCDRNLSSRDLNTLAVVLASTTELGRLFQKNTSQAEFEWFIQTVLTKHVVTCIPQYESAALNATVLM